MANAQAEAKQAQAAKTGLRAWFAKKAEEELERTRILRAEVDRWTLAPLARVPVLPEIKKRAEFDIRYPLIPPFATARVRWRKEEKTLVYEVEEPMLTDAEWELYRIIEEALTKVIDVKFGKIKTAEDAIALLKQKTLEVVEETGLELLPGQFTRVFYYIYRNFVGLNEIEPLMHDAYIEDIGCDGINVPIYVVHKKYGEIKTNVVFKKARKLQEFVIKLAERTGRYVSYAEPLLDGALPDGSRVQATLARDVTRRGPTISIRKFREIPYSAIDLLKLKTASVEMLAYLWYLIEHRRNIMIVGGTATGKTTFLNSISIFVPPEEKIVSIEDTAELNLPHENWISSVARVGFGAVTPEGVRYGEVNMFDLLRESFRQNPDYVIVGEVRGKEASVLFQGMASGHASFGTMHGGSVDDIIKRLQTPPIELPASLLEVLDVIIVIAKTPQFGKSARRIKSVNELLAVDPDTGKASFNVVFMWDPRRDTQKKRARSKILADIAEEYGIPTSAIQLELKTRERFLKWLFESRVTNFKEVAAYISLYYKAKEEALKEMRAGPAKKIKAAKLKVPKRVAKTRRPRKVKGRAKGKMRK